MACGRRLLMSTGRTVEIVALNSLILQQYKDFEGYGFLSDKQLEYVANKMGWKENGYTPDYTIHTFGECREILSRINKL